MSGLTEPEQRDFRNQLGDVWFLLATLLGHRSVETTRNVYLEPFQSLQVDQLVAVMEADDRAALERLIDVVSVDEARVLSVGARWAEVVAARRCPPRRGSAARCETVRQCCS